MIVKITKEEIEKKLDGWGRDDLNEVETELGRPLTEEDLKAILLYGLGYVKDSHELLDEVEYVEEYGLF